MEFDALFLSRIQFAFTIAFHIIFPAFTIGLASWLAALEFQSLRTGEPIYRNLYRFWVKVFAVSFGLGVVSGIVMSYQIGTNWSGFSEFAGNVVGPLIAYEVITAFFLEAAFLGIMLFGWERVGDRLHFLATCMVALGTLFSAFWILSANSWMQTPAGHAIENGIAVPVDWWRIVFNPSFPNRFAHGDGLLSHDGVRGRRHVGLDDPARPRRAARKDRRRAPLALDGAVVRGDLRAGADRARRPPRPQRAEGAADEARRDRGELDKAGGRAARALRLARREG